MKHVVYTETITENGIERWYYGTYDEDRANKVALELGGEYPTYHCVCREDEVEELEIKNLPGRHK